MWIQWLVHGIPDAPKANDRTAALADELISESERLGDWDAAMDIVRFS